MDRATAERIVDAIIDDMSGRSGLGNAFDACDPEIVDEIRETWIALVIGAANV